MIALPMSIPANKDIVRLYIYDYEDVHLPRVNFTMMLNAMDTPFGLRHESGMKCGKEFATRIKSSWIKTKILNFCGKINSSCKNNSFTQNFCLITEF